VAKVAVLGSGGGFGPLPKELFVIVDGDCGVDGVWGFCVGNVVKEDLSFRHCIGG
jgi:hypothetical protein